MFDIVSISWLRVDYVHRFHDQHLHIHISYSILFFLPFELSKWSVSNLITVYMYINYTIHKLHMLVKDACGWYNYHNDLILFVIHRQKQTMRESRSKMNMRSFRCVYNNITTVYHLDLYSWYICCIDCE